MKASLVLLLSILFCVSSYAVTDISFLFRYYNVENGLLSNSIRAILQDNQGYIWIGTNKGLNRYDGKNFVYYQKKNKEKHCLGENRIMSLYETSEGTIWVGTFSGIYIYNHKTDIFYLFEQQTEDGIKIESPINSITQDKDSIFWISTRGQGVFAFDPSRNSLKQYKLTHSQGNIYSVLVDFSNNIWLAGQSSTYLLNKVSSSFDVYTDQHGKAIYSTALFEDSSHNLWIGTWENGLLKINRNKELLTTYLSPSQKNGILHIHSIIEYAPGILLIGSDEGLAIFNTTTGETKEYGSEHGKHQTLSNKFVYPMIKDSEGGVWIGTSYGGINYITPNGGQFEGYSRKMYDNQLLSGDIISCFAEDGDGNIWIGSEDGGVSCFSQTKRQFLDFPGRDKTHQLYVTGLHMEEDMLWISTYAEGLCVLDIRTGLLKKMTHELPDYFIYSLLDDKKGKIWFGSVHSIYVYNKEEKTFSLIRKVGAPINNIVEDKQGIIWFATFGSGLFSFDPGKNKLQQYQQKEGIPSSVINHIYLSKDNRLWVGTEEGLCCYNKEEDSFYTIPLKTQSEAISCILEGGEGMWLTTDKGLVLYKPDKDNILEFSSKDGLQSETFIKGSGLKTKTGKLFIGTINGFNSFYPHKVVQNRKAPVVILTGLEVFNKKASVEKGGILTSRIDWMREIHLSYKENSISLHYAALSFVNPDKNQYAYKLEGFDKDWNYVNWLEKATYTNLPAGRYTFHVIASNNDNVWNEEGASINIVVHPPIFLSLPAKLIYIILIGLLITLITYFFLYKKENKHIKEIELLNANKEKEINQAKIDFFTTIAHEIRTPVSLIIGPLETIMNSANSIPSTIHENLETINRNSQRLLFLINQLLDFRKVENKETKMIFRYHNIYQLLQSEYLHFQASLIKHDIAFQIEYPQPDFIAAVDKEALTKIISNLLSNALKYTKDRIIILCRIHQKENRFTIEVTDNGEGIREEDMLHVFKPFYQKNNSKPGTGIGLTIVKELIQAHNGTIEINSKIGESTSFIVRLPITQIGVEEEQDTTDSPDKHPELMGKAVAIPEKSTIMIVDDNDEMLNFLSEHFKNYYNIISATNGTEALCLLEKHEITVIISDWMMPGMDGLAFCKAVRGNLLTSHIPFILLTAKTNLQAKITGLDGGADAYIEKPFSLLYLETRIRNLIEQRELLRQKFSQMPTVPLNSIAGNSADEKFLMQINQIIEANISNPDLSIVFLTEQLGISRSKFFIKTKSLMNTSPNELIQIIRLKKAASLLLEKQYRVNEVCYMIGFKDPSYFSKCFQKQFGINPINYAKNHTQE